jgi:hypothetical protein
VRLLRRVLRRRWNGFWRGGRLERVDNRLTMKETFIKVKVRGK